MNACLCIIRSITMEKKSKTSTLYQSYMHVAMTNDDVIIQSDSEREGEVDSCTS